MLELYHWEPNGACARVLITLKEKGLDFKSHYVDVLAFEQHKAPFLKLSESGEVPVLVDNGTAINESSYICEYLEEVYPQNPLMPKDALGRWAVREWQKYVDDYVGATASQLAWMHYEHAAFKNRERAALDKQIAVIPLKERRDYWTQSVNGYSDEAIERDRERLKQTIGRIEKALGETTWLAGNEYSLADIALFSFVNYLPKVLPAELNETAAPKTMAWLRNVSKRPGVKAALAMAKQPDPFAVAAPGPEPVRWG